MAEPPVPSPVPGQVSSSSIPTTPSSWPDKITTAFTSIPPETSHGNDILALLDYYNAYTLLLTHLFPMATTTEFNITCGIYQRFEGGAPPGKNQNQNHHPLTRENPFDSSVAVAVEYRGVPVVVVDIEPGRKVGREGSRGESVCRVLERVEGILMKVGEEEEEGEFEERKRILEAVGGRVVGVSAFGLGVCVQVFDREDFERHQDQNRNQDQDQDQDQDHGIISMGPSSGLQFPAPEGVLGSAGNIDVDIDINIPTGKVPGPDCEILDPGILAGDAQEEEVAKTPDPKDKLPDQVATSQTSPTTTTTTTPPPPPPTPPIPAPPLSLSHWEPTILSPDTIHTLTLLATEINTACKAYSNLHPRPSTLPPLVPYPYPFHQPPPLENDPNQERLLRDMAYARQVGEDSVWWNISFSLLGPDGKDGSERLLDVMKAWREGEGWRMDMAMGGGGALD